MELMKNSNNIASKKQYHYKLLSGAMNDLSLVNSLNDLGKEGYKVKEVAFPNNSEVKYIMEKETERFSLGEKEKQYYKGFKDCIYSYKKSLWHSPFEEPETDLFIRCLVELEPDYYDGRVFKVLDYHKNCGFSSTKGWLKMDDVVRWAYMKDILPSEGDVNETN